jgi:hypothetical protein
MMTSRNHQHEVRPMSAKSQAQSRNALQLVAPRALTAAIKTAAAREMCTVSEYSRRALILKLRADGIDPAAPVSNATA